MGSGAGLKRTPIHSRHVELGGRMVDFAGWHMPVQYSGVIDEHEAVRNAAGLFDVSHMGEARVRGTAALEYLQWITCNNVAKLTPGRAHYTALTTPAGTFVDDLLIYRIGEDDFFLVINAGNTPKDIAWLHEHAAKFDVEVNNVSDEWAQIAIQGPKAQGILQRRVEVDLAEIKYYGFVQTDVGGASCIVSRTGYTGEDGFEVYAPAAGGAAIWSDLLATGAADGLKPIGLAARDTLRLEAKMALYGNDIGDDTTVLEADLGWIVKLKKGDFIGRDVLARQKEEGVSRKLVGFEMRGRSVARQGYPTWHGGVQVGQVTSGTFAPHLKKPIGLTYLPTAQCEVGTEFEVEIRGKREAAVVVPTPFYQRPR